ncbi:MAG: hypothetical protein F4Y12_13270 [Acidimicrobiaceae bacterium]|nr:hypothetical protein [Acidimicrobiaceae bacterium]
MASGIWMMACAGLFAAACGTVSAPSTSDTVPASAEGSAGDDAPVVSTEPAEAPTTSTAARHASEEVLESLSAEASALIESWRSAVSASSGVWPGYDLAAIPTVLVLLDADRTVATVVAFNHPAPAPLGSSVLRVDVDGQDVAVIGSPADPDALASMAPFDFFADIGGTDTFVLIGQHGASGVEPGTPEFAALMAHESFHRYQFDNWSPDDRVQDIDGYDFSAANLELVLLENRILIAAYEAGTVSEIEHFARQFAAVRRARHERDSRTSLDELQERTEGSARYLEHLIGDSLGNVYTARNHTRELVFYDDSLDRGATANAGGIRSFFGFGRFYSSGASLLSLLDRLGVSVTDIASGLQDGSTPAELLAQRVGPVDKSQSVSVILTEHDPDGELAAGAANLAGLALEEGSTDLGTNAPAGTFGVSDDQIACLIERGVDINADNITVPDDVARTCFNDPDAGG